jgi:peptidoglycan/LPS O-acetylase OafA/YrhL
MTGHKIESGNKAKQILQLDGIRCIAICAILIGHWIAWDTSNYFLNTFPWTHAVMLFFVLSGFLITGILLRLKEKIEAGQITPGYALRAFYFRRAIRIFPIYYICVFYLTYINYQDVRSVFPWLATYTFNILDAAGREVPPAFNHFWSLAVEEQFYLIWPFLLLMIPRKHIMKGILVSILLSLLSKVGCAIFFSGNWKMGAYSSLNQVMPLALGALVAYCSMYKENWFFRIFCNRLFFYCTSIIYFTLFYISKQMPGSYVTVIIDDCLFSFFAAQLVALCSREKFKYLGKALLENKVVTYIGRISYGMYVYHMFVSSIFLSVVFPFIHLPVSNKHLMWFYYLVIVMATSSLSYFLLEKPLNSLKKRFPY